MSYGFQPQQGYGVPAPNSAQNLQFYPSTYSPAPVSGHGTPAAASYGYGAPSGSNPTGYSGAAPSSTYNSFSSGVGGGVSGRMGEAGGLRTGLLAAFGTEGYDGEPPLLEELGVNFAHIRSKTLAVLNPLARIDQHIMDDSDLAGPILFALLFGFFLLASGKVHFGYIYGLALLGSTSIHFILSLMSPPLSQSTTAHQNPTTDPIHAHSQSSIGSTHLSSTLTFPRSTSVLGYCLLPLVLTSLVGVVFPMDTMLGYILTSMAIAWCTYSASGMFCAVGRMSGMRGLVAYPLALFYVGFGIMGIFSSRGTGTLGKVASTGL